MRIGDNLSNQLSLYLNGKMNLEAFRDWHIGELLNRHHYTLDDQEILAHIEALYSQRLLGLSDPAFRDSLAALLPAEPSYNFSPLGESQFSETNDYCLQ
jgi:hypothetical protein